MTDELPEGWIQVSLKEIAVARMGETILAKQLDSTGLPVYSAGAANEPWGVLKFPKRPLGRGVVVVSARGSIGFPKIPNAERFASTQTTITLQFPDDFLSRFACQWLKTVDWKSLTSGGAIPMLTVGEINELVMPLAPSAEQQRIEEKLGKLLAEVDQCKQRMAKIPVLLERFRQSVLAAACSGRLTADFRDEGRSLDTAEEFLVKVELERTLGTRTRQHGKLPDAPNHSTETGLEIPSQWVTSTIDSLSSKVVDGVHKKPEYLPSGVPFLTVRNLTAGPGISFTQTSFISEADHRNFIKRADPEKGDVLITKDGTLGVVRIVDTDRPFSIFVSLAMIKPLIRTFGPYLATMLASPQVQERIVVTGTGLQHIHLRDLRAVEIPIPPESEQQEIVRRVETLFALADRIEERYQRAKKQVDSLTQSILARAFRGELVPTEADLAAREGRDYESAAQLLQHIQSLKIDKPESKGADRNRLRRRDE